MQGLKTMFDISRFKNLSGQETGYSKRVNALQALYVDPQYIEKTVQDALDNLKSGAKSFVIYGEPQSGKTEMMIVLTAKLLACFAPAGPRISRGNIIPRHHSTSLQLCFHGIFRLWT